MKFVFQSVSVTDEKKPGQKQGYQKAVVIYTYNGEPRKQTIVSFSNPSIFKTVTQELTPGQEIEVDVVKNGGGFNEWKSVNTAGGAGTSTSNMNGPPTASMNTATKVVGSNYETREERASRQVLIVKQSSLSAAVATLAPGAKAALDPDEVIALADRYKDYVFAQDEDDLSDV